MVTGATGGTPFESRRVEDLAVGDSEQGTRRVTERDILAFAEISGDANPIHVDREYARASRFGGLIAHGPLALGLAGGIVGTLLPGLGTVAVSATIRHLLPIYAGDEITTVATVAAIEPDTRHVTLALSWANQDGAAVAEGETVVVPPRRRVEPPTG